MTFKELAHLANKNTYYINKRIMHVLSSSFSDHTVSMSQTDNSEHTERYHLSVDSLNNWLRTY